MDPVLRVLKRLLQPLKGGLNCEAVTASSIDIPHGIIFRAVDVPAANGDSYPIFRYLFKQLFKLRFNFSALRFFALLLQHFIDDGFLAVFVELPFEGIFEFVYPVEE